MQGSIQRRLRRVILWTSYLLASCLKKSERIWAGVQQCPACVLRYEFRTYDNPDTIYSSVEPNKTCALLTVKFNFENDFIIYIHEDTHDASSRINKPNFTLSLCSVTEKSKSEWEAARGDVADISRTVSLLCDDRAGELLWWTLACSAMQKSPSEGETHNIVLSDVPILMMGREVDGLAFNALLVAWWRVNARFVLQGDAGVFVAKCALLQTKLLTYLLTSYYECEHLHSFCIQNIQYSTYTQN